MDKRDEDAVFALASFAYEQHSRAKELALEHNGVATETGIEKDVSRALRWYCLRDITWSDLRGELEKLLSS